MKIQQLIIIRKLLLLLKNQYPDEQLQELDVSYKNLLEKREFLSIIEHMRSGQKDENDPDFHSMNKTELMRWIKDEYYILDYLISILETKIGLK